MSATIDYFVLDENLQNRFLNRRFTQNLSHAFAFCALLHRILDNYEAISEMQLLINENSNQKVSLI